MRYRAVGHMVAAHSPSALPVMMGLAAARRFLGASFEWAAGVLEGALGLCVECKRTRSRRGCPKYEARIMCSDCMREMAACQCLREDA